MIVCGFVWELFGIDRLAFGDYEINSFEDKKLFKCFFGDRNFEFY